MTAIFFVTVKCYAYMRQRLGQGSSRETKEISPGVSAAGALCLGWTLSVAGPLIHGQPSVDLGATLPGPGPAATHRQLEGTSVKTRSRNSPVWPGSKVVGMMT